MSVLEPSQSANPEAYRHYLCLKQRALRQLSHDLSDPIGRNDDRTVAAIFVLVLLDAIESGSGEWRLHLEGAKNLLKSREATPAVPSMQRMIDGLHTFVIDACLMYVSSSLGDNNGLLTLQNRDNGIDARTAGCIVEAVLQQKHRPYSPEAARADILGRLPSASSRSDILCPRATIL